MANPKIHTKFIEMLMETMMKMRKYFNHWFVTMRYSVRANELLLVVVAIIPNVATRIVLRLMSLRLSLLIVSIWRPNPRETM